MLDPQQKAVAEEFDAYRASYSDTVNDALLIPGLKVDYFTKVKAEYLKDIVEAELGDHAKQRVLDVGCGVGNYHRLLQGTFAKLVGIDVSEQSVEQAKITNKDVEYDVYDGGRLPYEDGSFDVAYTICVMHHVPTSQWGNFAREMFRVLRGGGIGLVFEHNPSNPLTMRVVNRCPFDRDAVLLKPAKTRSLLEGAGFANVSTRSIINIPSIGKLTRFIDRSVLGHMPFGAQYVAVGRKS